MLLSLPCSDTLFLEDFSFTDFVAKFDELRCSEVGGALVSCYNCKDDGVCVCVAVCYIVAHLMVFDAFYFCFRDYKVWDR